MLNREIITIIRDRMSGGEEMAHKFAALQSHLDRGYSVCFSSDNASGTDWCYPIKTPPNAGDNTIEVYGNPFGGMGITNKPGVGQYAVIETAPPAAIYEVVKIQSISAGFNFQQGGTITLASGVNFTFPSSAYIRWYRHWPVLKRVESDRGKQIVTNEHGLSWSLDIRLTPDYDALYGFHPGIDSDFSPSSDDSTLTPEGVVRDPGSVFGDGIVTLDNPPRTHEELDMFETTNNAPWNYWQNWSM
jgi:hypothetical protein